MDLYQSHKNDVTDETNEILESIKELQVKQYKSVKNICSKLQEDRYERDAFIKKGSHWIEKLHIRSVAKKVDMKKYAFIKKSTIFTQSLRYFVKMRYILMRASFWQSFAMIGKKLLIF